MPKNLGCGPGNLIFDEDSWLSTHLASTVNYTLSPLLPSSTTSGISGCTAGPPIVDNRKAYEFFVSNFKGIMKDSAVGGGERLLALSKLWNQNQGDYQPFANAVKENYGSIFQGTPTSHKHIYQKLRALTKFKETT